MNNNIINAIYILIILYLLYNIYDDFKYHKNNKDNYVLCLDDFEKNLDNYKESNLYNKFNNLSDNDKKFLNDYIIYIMLKYKDDKPNFNKKIDKWKYNVIFPSIIANIHRISSGEFLLSSFKTNVLHHFSNTVF
jgi:hypothetical protein